MQKYIVNWLNVVFLKARNNNKKDEEDRKRENFMKLITKERNQKKLKRKTQGMK